MHPREISKLAKIKCKAVAAAFSQASKNHVVGGEKKLGKWVTRPSAFLARQRCRCAAKAAGREISTGLTAGKGKKEKHWGKLCPV